MVYVPPGYDQSTARLPVLYLQDGQNLFDPATAFNGQDWRADVTADELIHGGAIEPAILVGVYNTGVRRISEYTPTRDQVQALTPFIPPKSRTLNGGHAGGGSAGGGRGARVAALLYPRVFAAAAVLSPSVWWDRRSILEMVRNYKAAERPRIWLDSGTQEGETPEAVIEDLRLLRDALLEKGWREGVTLHYLEVAGAGHNEQAWAARFGAVLECLFPAP